MKAYLLKTAGIIVIATLAGVAHFALGEKIKFAEELDPIENTIERRGDDSTSTPPENVVEPTDSQSEPADDSAEEFVLTEAEKILQRDITLRQARYLYENDRAIFIDARLPEYYEQGHIEGAFSVSTEAFQSGPPFAVQVLDDSRYVVIYCGGGACEESKIVAEDLAIERPDLENMIHIFEDGYPAWESAGLPTDVGPDPYAE
ncbi:MAG: hypothetical protein Phyf2KO_21370 [Phycisphaerales bacterium]